MSETRILARVHRNSKKMFLIFFMNVNGLRKRGNPFATAFHEFAAEENVSNLNFSETLIFIFASTGDVKCTYKGSDMSSTVSWAKFPCLQRS